VREALLLAEIEGVHAMHDATEGGLTAALNEMAEASEVGFKVELEKIQVPKEVYALQERFQLSDEEVLSMSSTGTILAAVSPKAKGKVEEVLRKNDIKASFIGVFTEDKRRIIMKKGEVKTFPKRAEDPYEMILSGEP